MAKVSTFLQLLEIEIHGLLKLFPDFSFVCQSELSCPTKEIQYTIFPQANKTRLDLFDSYEWESTKDQAHYKKVVEDSRVYKFLTDLNDKFDEIRSRVTSRKLIGSLQTGKTSQVIKVTISPHLLLLIELIPIHSANSMLINS